MPSRLWSKTSRVRKREIQKRRRAQRKARRVLRTELLEDRRLLAASIDRAPYDVDGNGATDPLSDGIVILRYLAGFTGSTLMDGVVDPQGARTDEASIMSHLRDIEDAFLDPDGDVESKPLSDGIAVLRNLAGFSGDTLVDGVVNPQGIRRSPTFVEAYLDRPLNEPPVGTVGEYTVNEDSVLVVDAGSGLLSNITDADGDAITSILRTPPGNGVVEFQDDGAFTYTPEENVSGSDSFTFVAADEFGAETPFTVEVTINGVNDLPTLREASYSVPNDTLLEVSVDDGLFQFVEDLDGDDVSIPLASQAGNGVVTLDANGSFTYEPDANFHGLDAFGISLSDGSGEIVNAEVQIDVIPTNTKPVARALQYFVDEDTRLEVAAENGIFSGGTDADGDTLGLTDFERPDSDKGEWEYRVDGSFNFTPAPDFNGDVQFKYVVLDDDGNTSGDQAIGTITVVPVFDEPVPKDDVRDTAKNTKLRIDGDDSLLANDTFGDVEQSEIVILTPPEHGAIAMEDDGNGGQGLFYTPDTDYVGSDTFTYAVGDGTDSYGEATVTFSVTPRGDALLDSGTGVLSVFGTELDDQITVDTVISASNPDGQITALILPTGQAQVLKQFPRADVTAIRVFGFGGNDNFRNFLFENNQLTEIQLPIEAFGGLGNDILRGGAHDDLLVGGPGRDTIVGRGGNDTIYSANSDGVSDASGGDLRGGAGNDVIFGGLGSETLRGGSGNDTLIGGGPFLVNDEFPDEGFGDIFYGDDDGNDEFTSEVTIVPGDDTLIGSDGSDYLEGGGGKNTLDGGDGSDRYIFGPDLESVTSEHVITEPSPSVSRTGRDNSIEFRSGANYFSKPIYYDLSDTENVVNNSLTISVNNSRAFNQLHGGSGDDFLKGHENFVSNTILGHDGKDTILGGNQGRQLKRR